MRIISVLIVVLGLSSNFGFARQLSLDDFMSSPEVYDAELSPDGRYLADIVQVGKLRMVNIRDLTKEGHPVVGQIGDSVIRPYSLIWANDERLIVYLQVPLGTDNVRRRVERDDEYDIDENFMYSRSISIDVHGKTPVSLLTQSKGLRNQLNLSEIRHSMPKDSKHILMTAEYHEKQSLYKVNVYTGASDLVAMGSSNTIFFICNKDGEPLYRVDYEFLAKEIKLFSLENDNWVEFDSVEFNVDEVAINPEYLIGINASGNVLYRKINEKTGYYEILERDRKTKNLKTLISLPNKDVLGLVLNNDQVVGYKLEDNDVIVDRFFDEKKQFLYNKIINKMGGYAFSVNIFDENQERLIVRSSGLDYPGGIYFYSKDQDLISHYADFNSHLSSDDLAVPARVTFLTRDEVKVRMYLLLPPGYEKGKKYPLIVMPHGGPQSRDYFHYDDFAQFIATRGYIVAKPNFRGSTGYGREFEEAGYRQWGGIMQDDLQDAAKFLIQKGFADPQKVCLVGGSYGGYAALMGMVKHSDFYHCAVSLNGVTNLIAQVKYDEERFKNYKNLVARVHLTLGDPSKDKVNLKANSPSSNIDKMTKPVLIIAGTSDWVVRYYQSKSLAKKLKKLDRPVEYMEVDNAHHNIFNLRDDRKNIYMKVAQFLEKNLK